MNHGSGGGHMHVRVVECYYLNGGCGSSTDLKAIIGGLAV